MMNNGSGGRLIGEGAMGKKSKQYNEIIQRMEE